MARHGTNDSLLTAISGAFSTILIQATSYLTVASTLVNLSSLRHLPQNTITQKLKRTQAKTRQKIYGDVGGQRVQAMEHSVERTGIDEFTMPELDTTQIRDLIQVFGILLQFILPNKSSRPSPGLNGHQTFRKK